MNHDVILFDLDKTLGVGRIYRPSVLEFATRKGVVVPPELLEKLDKGIRREEPQFNRVIYSDDGDGLKNILWNLVDLVKAQGQAAFPQTVGDEIKLIARTIQNGYLPMEGAQQFVAEARKKGKIGFVTNAVRPIAENGLKGMGMLESNDVLVTREDGCDGPKQKVVGITTALTKLGVAPGRNVVYIGNALHDMEHTLELGCSGIWYTGNMTSGERLKANQMVARREGAFKGMPDGQVELCESFRTIDLLLESRSKVIAGQGRKVT